MRRLMACLGVSVMVGAALAAPASAAAPSDPARAELRGIIENVTGADAVRYGARDDAGHTMDTAKVIQDSTGGYLAVYHHMHTDRRFKVNLATSSDLMNWHWVRELAGSGTGGGASQPTITQVSNGGYVMAWEQEPSNHFAFRYFANRADLLSGAVSRRFDAPLSLSSCAEGTPNIYSVTLSPDTPAVARTQEAAHRRQEPQKAAAKLSTDDRESDIDHSVIDVGGHYWWNCDRDRQQRGRLTNFSSWSTAAQPNVDNALLHWGVGGNIGDRDAIRFRDYDFGVFEGQFVKGDFGSWRTFVYDYQTGNADQTTIRTAGGSTAFANPAITALRAPNGQPAILVTLFVPSEGAAPGEAGELIYYKTY